MRVNVKFNDFTVRKLKPNIFENYQLIEAAAQQQQQSSVKENDEHVTEGSHETGEINEWLNICQLPPQDRTRLVKR